MWLSVSHYRQLVWTRIIQCTVLYRYYWPVVHYHDYILAFKNPYLPYSPLPDHPSSPLYCPSSPYRPSASSAHCLCPLHATYDKYCDNKKCLTPSHNVTQSYEAFYCSAELLYFSKSEIVYVCWSCFFIFYCELIQGVKYNIHW